MVFLNSEVWNDKCESAVRLQLYVRFLQHSQQSIWEVLFTSLSAVLFVSDQLSLRLSRPTSSTSSHRFQPNTTRQPNEYDTTVRDVLLLIVKPICQVISAISFSAIAVVGGIFHYHSIAIPRFPNISPLTPSYRFRVISMGDFVSDSGEARRRNTTIPEFLLSR